MTLIYFNSVGSARKHQVMLANRGMTSELNDSDAFPGLAIPLTSGAQVNCSDSSGVRISSHNQIYLIPAKDLADRHNISFVKL